MKLTVALAVFSILALITLPLFTTSVLAEKPDKQTIAVDEKTTKQLFKQHDGTVLERTTHIFYLKGSEAKTNNANGGTDKCYSFLASGMKWKNTEQYLVNPSTSGLTDAYVLTTIDTGIEAWDGQVSFDVFGTSSIDNNAQVLLTNVDNKNVVIFGTVTDNSGKILTNVIAVTYTWAYWNAPVPSRQILEWDMIFNKGVFNFGDASVNPSLMDLGGIGTHELGHAAGMGHTSSSSICQDQTMYPTASFGEIKKRTLEFGDITGIKKLYS